MLDADLLRAGEGDEARLRVLHERVADLAAAARQEVDHARRDARPPPCISTNLVGDDRRVDAGFSTTVFPATTPPIVIPVRIAQGKFQGGITTPTPSGM